MTWRIGRTAASWLARWGFAALVALGVMFACVVAATVEVPGELPSYALQAAPVYRLEVGAAVFAAVYAASLAFVLALALGNRGFTELSASGVKASDLQGVTRDVAIKQHTEMLDALTASVAELEATAASNERLDME